MYEDDPKTLLIVTKDKGGFNAVSPLLPELRRRGYTIRVVAEGLSAELWKKTGETLAFRGSADFTKEPFTCDVDGILNDIAPHIVLVTAGAPMNLEQQFAQAALRRQGILVVTVEDSVGAAISGAHAVIQITQSQPLDAEAAANAIGLARMEFNAI